MLSVSVSSTPHRESIALTAGCLVFTALLLIIGRTGLYLRGLVYLALTLVSLALVSNCFVAVAGWGFKALRGQVPFFLAVVGGYASGLVGLAVVGAAIIWALEVIYGGTELQAKPSVTPGG
jgi:hypothetical protein